MAASSPTYWDLVKPHKEKFRKATGQILHFEGIGEKDIYNPTIIEDHGIHYIAARVESRNSDWMITERYDPQVMFFEKQQYGPWVPIKNAPVFAPMEDPFATWVHDEGKRKLIFGGVVILDRSVSPPIFGTVFYKGDDIYSLEKEPFVTIPMMKDIRLVERIHKKEIIVCTRPMMHGYNTGRIGIARIEKLSDLSEKIIYDAFIEIDQVAEGTWVGNNKLYVIESKQSKKEQIGIVGHTATVDADGSQHYAAMTCTFDADHLVDPLDPLMTPHVIATRQDFEDGPAKLETLKDVVFPAGLEHLENGMAKLYAGLSDARIGVILIPDPFKRHQI